MENTKKIKIGGLFIGGGERVAVQSMTNTDTHDTEATYTQIKALADKSCDIVRLAVPDIEAAKTIAVLKERGITLPLVADIHFDYKIALECVECGADKIRINPGNIGDDCKVKAVADACRRAGIPIRIGVNSGSLEREILAKYGSPTPDALAESALYHASLLEKFDFTDIVLSVKSSNVKNMIAANRILAERSKYPLHLGVTEAGSERVGIVKSSVGIGSLLCDGIGDTIRVSLTADPVREVESARILLGSIGLSSDNSINIVSCPTCGRTKIDLISLVAKFEEIAPDLKPSRPITVAMMGCVVNGPGEAREADIGVAGGIGEAVLFKKGEIVCKIPEDRIIQTLAEEIKMM